MTETGMAPAISGKDQKGPGRTKSIMQRASHARGKLLNTIRGMHASSEHSHPHTRYVTVFTLHTDCVPDHLLFQQIYSLLVSRTYLLRSSLSTSTTTSPASRYDFHFLPVNL